MLLSTVHYSLTMLSLIFTHRSGTKLGPRPGTMPVRTYIAYSSTGCVISTADLLRLLRFARCVLGIVRFRFLCRLDGQNNLLDEVACLLSITCTLLSCIAIGVLNSRGRTNVLPLQRQALSRLTSSLSWRRRPFALRA